MIENPPTPETSASKIMEVVGFDEARNALARVIEYAEHSDNKNRDHEEIENIATLFKTHSVAGEVRSKLKEEFTKEQIIAAEQLMRKTLGAKRAKHEITDKISLINEKTGIALNNEEGTYTVGMFSLVGLFPEKGVVVKILDSESPSPIPDKMNYWNESRLWLKKYFGDFVIDENVLDEKNGLVIAPYIHGRDLIDDLRTSKIEWNEAIAQNLSELVDKLKLARDKYFLPDLIGVDNVKYNPRSGDIKLIDTNVVFRLDNVKNSKRNEDFEANSKIVDLLVSFINSH